MERPFGSMKTIDLHVRPVFHYTGQRVRAHVFLCMLAYYVEWHMRERLKPMLFDDEHIDEASEARASPVAKALRSEHARAKGASKTADDGTPFANPQSLVAMYGVQWLRQQNMEPGRDYEVKGARTDLGVGRMLLSADAVAAIMSNGEFRGLPPEESARLKIVEVFARLPNFIVLAHPRLPSEQQASLKLQLKAFLADKADGAAFAQATGVTAIVDVDDNVLRELDAFVVPTRRAIGYGK